MRRPSVPLLALLALAVGCGDGDEPAGAARYDRDGRLVGEVARPERPPNLVLIVIDTLRADALGWPGGPGGEMPFLASLAARGARFPDATAPAPWTVPSMVSLLTGLLPSEHRSSAPREPPRVMDAITTFAEALGRGYGYETAAFVSGPWFAAAGGPLQGFARVETSFGLQATEPLVGPWVRSRDPKRPFFLLLHTFEAHDPYGAEDHPWPEREPTGAGVEPLEAPEPWQLARGFLLSGEERAAYGRRMPPRVYMDRVVRYLHGGLRDEPRPELAEELRGAYLEGVRWVDGLLAKTVASLEAWGLLENTLLVVTSDHGEGFGEHGRLEHGAVLFDELVRVPLVVVGPEPFRGGRSPRGGVGLIDVLPTFFEWAGLHPVQGVQGRSFLPFAAGRAPGRPVRSEERVDRNNTGEERADAFLASVRSERWKYVVAWDRTAGTVVESAYDLAADPGETNDLAKDGRIDRLTFDPDFCREVESVRDLLWGEVEASNRLEGHVYGAGTARVRGDRPKRCNAAGAESPPPR